MYVRRRLQFQNRQILILPDQTEGVVDDILHRHRLADFLGDFIILGKHDILRPDRRQHLAEACPRLILAHLLREIVPYQRIAVYNIHISVYIMIIIVFLIRKILGIHIRRIHQNAGCQIIRLRHLIIESEEILFQKSLCQVLVIGFRIVVRIFYHSVIHDNGLRLHHHRVEQA